MTHASSSNIAHSETHRVRVTYAMPPLELLRPLEKNFRMLRRMYEMYDAEERWVKHPTCAGLDQKPAVRSMRVIRFGRPFANIDAAIAAMQAEGCRPATQLEAVAYFVEVPQSRHLHPWIIALGACRIDDGTRRVALLTDGVARPHIYFTHNHYGEGFSDEMRYLCVER